ncbi:MAG: glucosidase [candidate division KSB1 bacterium]|nr:glucosidase [candidate division KSB1 bacterium]MDZ7364713.1 glucosidase [candidate division KSB1 bacterium]MDZ7402539.1 glucosidase [candidate division KSB1 bacterium]
MNAEKQRLEESRLKKAAWKKWGPYVTERQWGTVREDYSPYGNAWEYVSHDAARSKAFRWGEEGIAGICDERQLLCFALALWNGRDPILKERLFGLTGNEGNHGEDVKEYYYYLDSTPTHSYMKMLYKYPQHEFPYGWLVEENRRRGKDAPEFELIDTGIFNDDRYFDVFVEYAKAAPEDVLIRLTAHNRGPEAATLHLLPTIWFRNTWAWGYNGHKPNMMVTARGGIEINQTDLGKMWLLCEGDPKFLFCDNETNIKRLYNVDAKGYCKDGINEYVVHGNKSGVNPAQMGTKAAAHYVFNIPAGRSAAVRLRLTNLATSTDKAFVDFDATFAKRLKETDEFYADIQWQMKDDDAKNVQRQAFAGMLWSKQFYYFDIPQWLNGDPGQPPPPPERKHGRNSEWLHLNNAEIISMPDKWEYPWYAAWDLAFHCIPLAMIDADFAKEQLVLLTREWYMHPNGQLPAYEWAFGDVNPPVHAWATWRVFQIDRKLNGGKGDIVFLERVFQKLLLNFTWWVNRKDAHGMNIFQGGFLGLDNIGVFDRSAPLPTGGHIAQADGTSWMAMYSLNMMRISLELALHNPTVYQDMATKFFEHFLYIAGATANIGGEGINLWDQQDEFFYDVLHLPNDAKIPLKVRSMVGLIPLFAVETLEPDLLDKVPEFKARLEWFLNYRPDLANLVSRWHEPGLGERRLLSLLRGRRMKRLLKRMLDETEFLSDYGVRALSRIHDDHPYVFHVNGNTFTVKYQPAESDSGLFGGNSNWRGPIWMPVNYLIIESLQKFHHYYGDDFKVECPTGSGKFITINEVANELSRRLTRIFLKDERGRRPVLGYSEKMQNDPNFRDYVLFHEYFHGDNGRGVGASHQTGWTGLVAKLLQPRAAEKA